jgi:hypothetical protein
LIVGPFNKFDDGQRSLDGMAVWSSSGWFSGIT